MGEVFTEKEARNTSEFNCDTLNTLNATAIIKEK